MQDQRATGLLPRIVLRVDVGESWTDGADLYQRFFVHEDIVRSARRKDEETACGQRLGLALIGGLSHPQLELPRNYRDDFVDRMHMRRNPIALRQLELERKQAFLARIAERDRRLQAEAPRGLAPF
jgi:hypothetical protein